MIPATRIYSIRGISSLGNKIINKSIAALSVIDNSSLYILHWSQVIACEAIHVSKLNSLVDFNIRRILLIVPLSDTGIW